MSNLPRVSLNDLPDEERGAASALIEKLGDDLTALALHGSHARGEAHEGSDHDFILVMRRLESEQMGTLAAVFRDKTEPWSTYIVTEDGLRQYPSHGRCQFNFGLKLIHGDFEPPPVSRETALADMRNFAVNIAHEARYRVIHKAGPDRASDDYGRNGRLLHYRAKEAVLAMKSRELFHGREYPATRDELRERIRDDVELAIIDIVDLWPEFRTLYEADFVPLALLLNRFVGKLIAELPAE